MRSLAATLALLAAGVLSASGQPVPFDMTPERPPVTGNDPRPSVPPSPGGEQPPTVPPARSPEGRHRLILPDGSMTLSGEASARSWALHLTSAQADAQAALHLGYRNAVVAAPEISRLELVVNGTTILDEAVRSAAEFANLSATLPSGLLREGRNEVSVRVRHRHRTDCTIASTYELWTEVDSARTFLSFPDLAENVYAGLESLRALSPAADGTVRIDVVVPAMARGDLSADVMRLVQALALKINMPRMHFTIDSAHRTEPDASLTVVLGAADELGGLDLEHAAINGPIAAFLPLSGQAAPTLLVGGRNQAEWQAAIDQVASAVERPAGDARQIFPTETWRLPEAPLVYGHREFRLSELGVRSERFSGRRYTSDFQFALPGDFYASSYGSARLYIDAAFSRAVLPGSLINVFVNGSIAASTSLAERSGKVLEQLPINVTMRHFRPGLNAVTIEVDLLTAKDEACLPGAAGDTTQRFALFDTSRFVIPDFGRIGQRPNLDATAGTGFPYGETGAPVVVVAQRGDAASLSASANLLARLATSAGHIIPVEFSGSADAARDRDAIIVGPVNGIPASVLAQVDVAEESRTSWTVVAGQGGGDVVDAEEWRREMVDSGWVERMRDWFSSTFNITVDMLRFAPADEVAFMPSSPAILFVAQGANPAGSGTWTVASAPDGVKLSEGMRALTDLGNWSKLSGRLSTLDDDLATVSALPPAATSFVQTQPPSFGNFRLIAANWLSANILSYALLLVAACVFLGLATAALLMRLGKPE